MLALAGLGNFTLLVFRFLKPTYMASSLVLIVAMVHSALRPISNEQAMSQQFAKSKAEIEKSKSKVKVAAPDGFVDEMDIGLAEETVTFMAESPSHSSGTLTRRKNAHVADDATFMKEQSKVPSYYG